LRRGWGKKKKKENGMRKKSIIFFRTGGKGPGLVDLRVGEGFF